MASSYMEQLQKDLPEFSQRHPHSIHLSAAETFLPEIANLMEAQRNYWLTRCKFSTRMFKALTAFEQSSVPCVLLGLICSLQIPRLITTLHVSLYVKQH